MNKNHIKKAAPLLIIIAGILWGSMGLFVRRLNNAGLASMEIVSLRAIVSCIFLFLFLLIFQRKLLKIRIRDLWCFLGTGICSIIFFNYCYFKTITLTSLSTAAVLLYTAPAIVMVLSYFLFKEKFTGRKLLALFMTLCGCVLVTGVLTDPGELSVQGILTGLGSGLGYALYSIFSRYALERGYHSLTIIFYTFLIAAVVSLFMTDTGQIFQVATENAGTFFFCIAFGVVCTVIPYLTYTLGLQYVDNSRASIMASVEPVTATLLGIFVFQEELTLTGVAGMILVLAALAVCQDHPEKMPDCPEKKPR